MKLKSTSSEVYFSEFNELWFSFYESMDSIFCIDVKIIAHESVSKIFGKQWAMFNKVLHAKMFFSFGCDLCFGIEKSQRASMKLFRSFFHPKIPEMFMKVWMLFSIYWILVSFPEISNKHYRIASKF